MGGDEELNKEEVVGEFDPSKKKKKKKPKERAGEEEDAEGTTTEQVAVMTEQVGELSVADGGLEVVDFGKKKKKKQSKKEGSADEAGTGGEGAPAAAGPAGSTAEEGAGEPPLDLLLMKKKKKKKQRAPEEGFEEEEEADSGKAAAAAASVPEPVKEEGDDEEEGKDGGVEQDEDEDNIDEEGEEDEEAGEIVLGGPTSLPWEGSDRDYVYEELLGRVFDILRAKNPQLAGDRRRTVMRPPQVLREGTKKTVFVNFMELCKSMHRPPEHVQAFLLSELGTSGSLDGQQRLVVKGRFMPKNFEGLLRRYITEYVICHGCKSPDTTLSKENRLFFLRCEQCGSHRSVQQIKAGFQARVTKREKTG